MSEERTFDRIYYDMEVLDQTLNIALGVFPDELHLLQSEVGAPVLPTDAAFRDIQLSRMEWRIGRLREVRQRFSAQIEAADGRVAPRLPKAALPSDLQRVGLRPDRPVACATDSAARAGTGLPDLADGLSRPVHARVADDPTGTIHRP